MKFVKKILPMIIALSFVLSLIPMVTVSADTWDGTSAATAFESGDGTEANPFIIKTAAQLKYLANRVNGEAGQVADPMTGLYVKLDADIDLGGKAWTPIGSTTKIVFSGIFDGNDHTISGLLQDVPTSEVGGFFGAVKGGAIKNLYLMGTKVSGGKYVGGLVGYPTHGTQIVNCYVNITEVIGEVAGGVVGRAQTVAENEDKTWNSIILCTFEGSVSGTSGLYGAGRTAYVGGVCGVAGHTYIRYSINKGTVVADANGDKAPIVGGIIGCQGASSGATYVDHCINIGDVTAKGDAARVGGVVGKANHVAGGMINYCINIGNVSTESSTNYIGAIAGQYGNNSCEYGYHHNVSVRIGELLLEGSEAGDENTTATSCDDFYCDFGKFAIDPVNYVWERSCKFVEVADVTGVGAVEKLIGYSSDLWEDGTETPTPKKDAVLAKLADTTWWETEPLPEFEEVTTDPSVTTETPGDETTTPEDETTEAPGTADTPNNTEGPAATTEAPEGGCGSMVAGSFALVAVISLAGVMLKKKN